MITYFLCQAAYVAKVAFIVYGCLSHFPLVSSLTQTHTHTRARQTHTHSGMQLAPCLSAVRFGSPCVINVSAASVPKTYAHQCRWGLFICWHLLLPLSAPLISFFFCNSVATKCSTAQNRAEQLQNCTGAAKVDWPSLLLIWQKHAQWVRGSVKCVM